MKRLALSLLLLSAFYEAKSQTQFWSDNFEDAGAPSSGTRTPSTTFSCGAPATNYFYRTDLAGIALQSGSYTNYDGSKFWAGEDIDFGPSCSNVSISPNQQVTWSGINISGKTGLSFKGLFAANSSFASNWEGSSFAPNQDFIAVEYSIDGGPWTKALAFYASSSSQSQTLKQETTGDLIGDGADLTYTFTEFSANLTGTGTTMDIRLNVSANGSATEEIAVDNFRLFETPACPTPSLTIVSQSNVSCNGGSNGAATVSASGGTSFTYSWSPSGGSSASASGLSTGTYTCTTTNNCGSSASTTVTITQPTAVNVIAVSQTNIACNGGSNGAASVTVFGGTSGYTYNWTPGTPTGDGTANVSGLTAGTWTCTVTDANACTATQSFNLTAPTALVVSPSSQTNIACNGGSNGAASVSVSGGTSGYTYNWTPGTPTGDGTANVSGLTAGTWTCTVTDANACTATQSFNLTAPTAIVLTTSFTNVTCNGSCNGTATVTASGGTPAYTYSWAPSGGTAATATGLCAGTYTVSVTDANACTATQTVTITEPTAIVLTTSSTNVTCNGSCNGTATVTASGGTPAYTYSWAPGGGTAATATGLCAGTYTVSVTDANACTATQTVTITEPAAIVLTTSSTNVTCNGSCNGTATVTASGGTPAYTYSWAPSGGTAATATGLCAGTYTVSVTDANACTATQTVTITEPTAIVLTASSTNVTCNGSCNGTATVTASGGTPAYTYSWAPSGGTAATATGLCAGTYTVSVTDANACTATQTVTITEPTAIVLTTSSTNVTCNGSCNGTATVTASGGTPAYTYSWAPGGGTAATASGLCAGTYTVSVTDANACTATQTVTITEPTAITGTQTLTLCAGQTITIGTNTYSTTGTYTDVLTAFGGCDSTLTTNLTVNPAIDVTTSLSGNTITANASSASYQWVDCDSGNSMISGETNQSYTATANGNYAVIVSESGCADTSACVNINSTGISGQTAGTSVQIYPNPTNAQITLEGLDSGCIVVVMNSIGQEMLVLQATSASSQTIDMSSFANGIYFIRISSTNGSFMKKIVKE